VLRQSPPVVGLAAFVLSRQARGAVLRNLRRVRHASPLEDARDAARTFTTFAGALAESLAAGSKNEEPLAAVLEGREHLESLLGGPFVIGTIHSGGWDVLGALLTGPLALDVMVVMAPEADARARALHDAARSRAGVKVVHVGEGALDALPLLRQLRGGGVVAVQLDRTPAGMRAVPVRLFDADDKIPEGPLHLARLTGAPVIPIFCARLGFRRYLVRMCPPVRVARDADAGEMARAAQALADDVTAFVREHPSQWFAFA
jgi:KDO2-lipid IV(A) lauroyltransferase